MMMMMNILTRAVAVQEYTCARGGGGGSSSTAGSIGSSRAIRARA